MEAFDDLALVYDQAINWTQRLNHELPFLRVLLENQPQARVLDLACGSGRHAIALATQGYEVTGLDASQSMIDTAIHLAQEEKVQVQFLVGDMQDAKTLLEAPFDLVMCLGNSLALLPHHKTLNQTLKGVRSLLGQTGTFVAQVLNFQEIYQTGFRFFPLKSGTTNTGEEVVFARFFEPITDRTTATLVFTGFIKRKSTWDVKVNTQTVLQLTHALLDQSLQDAGFKDVQYYANYEGAPFSASESRNLIAVARVALITKK